MTGGWCLRSSRGNRRWVEYNDGYNVHLTTIVSGGRSEELAIGLSDANGGR